MKKILVSLLLIVSSLFAEEIAEEPKENSKNFYLAFTDGSELGLGVIAWMHLQ